METKMGWITLNILLPLLPLILRAITKISMAHFDLETISSSELWFVLALMSLIICQDLKIRHALLDNEDKMEERANRATIFLVLFCIFVFLSALSEALFVAVERDHHDYTGGYICMTLISYVSTYLLINYALKTREEFKLIAKIL